MVHAGQISLYVDVMLLETVLADPKLYKKGGTISDVVGKIKEYFGSKYDPEHPNASVINELAPAVVWKLFSAMGFGKWGILAGLLMSTFHVDVSSLLSSIYDKVKEMIGSGKKMTSQQINGAVDSSIAEHAGNEANDGKVLTSLDLLPQARLIRLAMIDYEQQLLRLTKADTLPQIVSFGAAPNKLQATSLLGKLFGLVLKIGLASAGFMVAGDTINYILGRPNSFTGNYHAGKTETSAPAAESSGPTSTQKKYPFKGDTALPRSVNIQNTDQNIENMVLQFAKDIYSGLDGKEQLIERTPGFQGVVHQISSFNNTNQNSAQTFIPPFFGSKKKMVDYFIDDVAKSDA